MSGLEALEHSPASAAGVLQYLRGWLPDQNLYRRPSALNIVCCMLQALHEVLKHHPALRDGVIHVCESALRAQGVHVPLLSRRFVDILVTCVLLGHVDDVLGSMEALIEDGVIDSAVVRYESLPLHDKTIGIH